jgi:coproporphyrinogen III oxidase-like Fe-S oxidoreductase
VRHPAAYTTAVSGGGWPVQARELLTADERHTEDVMLRLRLAEGLPLDRLGPGARRAAARAAADGLLAPERLAAGQAVLTLPGRLLADGVVRKLLLDDLD